MFLTFSSGCSSLRFVTVLEIIQKGAEFLAKRGVDSPRLQVELMLAHQLQIPRLRLYLDFERKVGEDDVVALRALAARRGERVPLQHLLGVAPFYGLDFEVGPEVLVPRPETELLVEKGLLWLKHRLATEPSPAVLDYGTGSGCIAVSLAKNCPAARVHALDISPAALERARANAARHGVGDRVEFWASDGLNGLDPGLSFDLILSNPPYVPAGEIATLEPEVRDHDPRLALDGGVDGLTFYRRQASELAGVLRSGGGWIFELGDGQSEAVRESLLQQNWIVETVHNDYNAKPRVMIARRE